MSYSQVLHACAIQMGADLDRADVVYEVATTDHDLVIAAGVVKACTVCTIEMRFDAVPVRPGPA
jgi:hypothetical protein